MRRKKYVQFSGWAFVGAALSRLLEFLYSSRGSANRKQNIRRSRSGLERGLWLERNDDDA